MESQMKAPIGVADQLLTQLGILRPLEDQVGLHGQGGYLLIGKDGAVKQSGLFTNLITDIGDNYYASKGGALTMNTVTGMRLGTGVTAVAKNGAGAAIVTYTTASSIAIDGGFPTSVTKGAGAGWRLTWQTTWVAGVATANSLAEAVITNETALTNVAGTAANTISRGLLSPVVNKGASDQLIIVWQHDFLGA